MGDIYKRLLLFIGGCFLFLNVSRAQSGPINDLVNAVRYGRVVDISRYMDNVVPITINNTQSIYSHTQAEMVLKDFFNKNTPSDFILGNTGSGNSNSIFAIGELITTTGKYNVYILVKSKDANYTLQEIRFNKE